MERLEAGRATLERSPFFSRTAFEVAESGIHINQDGKKRRSGMRMLAFPDVTPAHLFRRGSIPHWTEMEPEIPRATGDRGALQDLC